MKPFDLVQSATVLAPFPGDPFMLTVVVRSNRVSILACLAFSMILAVSPDRTFSEIQFRDGPVELQKTDSLQAAAWLGQAARQAGRKHVVVQFDSPVTADERAKLDASGVRLLDSLGGHAYFAVVSGHRLDEARVAEVTKLRSAVEIALEWKQHPMLNRREVPTWAVVTPLPEPAVLDKSEDEKMRETAQNPVVGAYVRFHPDVNLDTEAVHLCREYGADVRSYMRTINALVIELPFDSIPGLAAEDKVQWVEPPLPRMSETNDSNLVRVGADIVQAPPYGLDGTGVTALIYDGGRGRSTHVDFGGRHVNGDTSSVSDHATHVAGTVGGSGAASGGVRKGMAPNVQLLGYGFQFDGNGTFLYTNPGDLESDYNDAINNRGADISNNSIGTNTETNGFPCSIQGDYGLTSMVIDSIVRGSLGAPFRVVWANGNERQGTRCDVEGFGRYYSTAPPAGAKNHITVGALNSNDDSMTSFSSWGPVDDGRIKPDISGPGCQSGGDNGVTSCSSSSDTAYSVKCGTSMSSPTVCGIGALILQDYRAQYPGEPDFRNSTLKVLLAQTAVDLGNVGPDFQFGYGSVRVQPAIDLMRAGNFLEAEVSQDQVFAVLVVVNPGDPVMKVTLAWDDVPATPNTNPTLVNDLDLVVFDPGNNRRYPWTLNHLAPSAPAVQTQEDHINNIEQVEVQSPPPGLYRVEVRGLNVPQGPQSFSLCASPLLVNCSSRGVIAMEHRKYKCSSTVTLRVVDCDLNTDDGLVETVSVTIASDSEPAGETVLLTETGPDKATFVGTISISTTDAAGVLLVADGDDLIATYIDADDGEGGINVPATDTVVVDCAPPVISNVMVPVVAARNATITFDTDELASASVRYGLSCGSLTETQAADGFYATHAVSLSNLQDNATYFFVVDAQDQAGNIATDDNGGACYTFTTPEVPEKFTELFSSADNDLDFLSILFVPNGSNDFYAACATPISVLPTDPAGGTTLSLSDDGNQPVTLTGGDTVQLYGQSWGSFFVNANGNITFGSSDGTYTESLSAHFSKPRVAALFDDLNPSTGGNVSWKQLSDRAVVTYLNVPEYNTSNQNTFQIELFFDGRIQISYLSIAATDGLAGLSEGLGLSPDFFETDLSALGDCGPRPPSVGNASVEVPQDGDVTINLVASDDGTPDPLAFIITTLPTHELRDVGNNHLITAGELPYTLVGNGNQVNYTPAPGFSGLDSFQYKANDGGTPPDGGDSNIGTISITVVPVLGLPFFDEFPATTFDPLKWSVVTGATIDNVCINPPSPPFAARFNGSPSGTDQIRTHAFNLVGAGQVRLTYGWQIRGGGDSPEAGDDLFVEYLDGVGNWQILRQHLGSGPDMTTFTTEDLILPAQALHSTFSLRFRNTATTGAFDDWFVDDVSLVHANAPVAVDGAIITPENILQNAALVASDPNMDPLTYTIMTLPANGKLRDNGAGTAILSAPYSLAGGGNSVRYTPNLGYTGLDSFTFKADDGTNDSNIATISVTVGMPQPVHFFPLNSNPGWSVQGLWAFGQPTGGGSHNRDPTSGFTGSNVYGYNLSGDYPNGMQDPMYLTTTAIDCSTVSGALLRFRRWLGIESSTYDQANIEISTNGTIWTTVWQHAGPSISESSWSLQTYDISLIADGKPAVYLRWGIGPTDSSLSYPGWNIDDIEILGMVPGVCTVGLYGDVNTDNEVNGIDLQKFAEVLVSPGSATQAEKCAADVHADGTVDMVDLTEFVEMLLQ